MPYISQEERTLFNEGIDYLVDFIMSEGDANYVITKILLEAFDPQRYSDYNKIIGILECAKLEFYRRAAAPYEDVKAEIHGDVYPPMSVPIESSH